MSEDIHNLTARVRLGPDGIPYCLVCKRWVDSFERFYPYDAVYNSQGFAGYERTGPTEYTISCHGETIKMIGNFLVEESRHAWNDHGKDVTGLGVCAGPLVLGRYQSR